MFSNFRSTFFLGTASSSRFSLYMSNITPKKIKENPEIIYTGQNMTFCLKYL